MVQNLNNNLITAPELADLRKRLRNLETKVTHWLKTLWCRDNWLTDGLTGWTGILRRSLPLLVL
jgi:hypothetical protein